MRNKRQRRKKLNRVDYSYDYFIVERIKDLNEKYIKLFIDLHTHQSVVDADFFIAAQQTLTQQYRDELALLQAQEKPNTDAKFYLAESKSSLLEISLSRRRRGWFKKSIWESSPTKNVLDERAAREVAGYIDELIKGVEPAPEEDEEGDPEPEELEEFKEFEEDSNQEEPGSAEVLEETEYDELEGEDDTLNPEDFEIKEGELDELDELEDIEDEEPSEKADLPPVVVAEQTAMVFVSMSAEQAEPVNEPAKTANAETENENGEDINGENKNE